MAKLSVKRLHIEKANANMVITIAVAAFIVVFSLVACRSLLSKRSYQNKVIAQKEQARDQLIANNEAVTKLVDAYKVFVSSPDNVIGGTSTGKGDKDGDNAQIILDALPSKYDYPGLASSIEKLLSAKGYTLEDITGTDDELNQVQQASNPNPQPIPIPFEFTVRGDFKAMQNLFKLLSSSIRPFHVNKVEIEGSDDFKLKTKVTAKTYYLPAKGLSIETKVVE